MNKTSTTKKAWQQNLLLILLLFISQVTLAQGTMGRWQTCGLSGTTSGTLAATGVVSNVSFSVLSRGSGLSATSATDGYSSSGFSTQGFLNTGNNDYYEFTITPATGYKISISALRLRDQVSSTSSSFNAELRYSENNFGSTLTSWAPSTTATNRTINTSGLASLQNRTTPVTFRVYGYDAAATTTTYRIDCQGTGSGNFRGIDVDGVVTGTYKSQFISANTGATTWCPGETRNITVTVKNTGTLPWTDGPGGNPDFNIGVKWNTNGGNWTDYHVRADVANLAAGATTTFTIPFTASNNTGGGYTTPLSAGTNNITFDIVYEGVSWFGDNTGIVGPGNTEFVTGNITIATGPGAVAGTARPAICQGGTTAALGGSFSGSATGATWSTPAGGSFSPSASNVNATWTPPANFSGTATLTLTTSGGTCGTATSSKTQTVNATPTAEAGNPMNTICQGGTTGGLGGAVGGSATGGTWSSTAGGTFSPNANTLNATWTPPVAFNGTATLTLTTTGGAPCGAVSDTKTQVVTASTTANAGPALSTICQGGVTAALNGSVGGTATGGVWSTTSGGSFSPNATTLNATWTPPAAFNGSATLVLTSSGGTCGTATASKTQLVNAGPASLTVSPAAATICLGENIGLTASATLPVSAFTVDNFNGASSFISSGSASGNRSQAWQQEVNGVTVNSVTAFSSPNGGSLMASTAASSDIFGGTSSANTTLTSAAINTTVFTSLSTLTFYHTYKQGNNSGSGTVQVSANGGGTWTTLATFNSNQGSAGNFDLETFNLSAYNNLADVRLRFVFATGNQNFFSVSTSWWAIDDVMLNGVRIPVYAWSANTAAAVNGLPANAGLPSISNRIISVDPSATTAYTLAATNPVNNCVATASPVTVTVNAAPSFTALPGVNINTSIDGAGNCTAGYAWTHPAVNTNCPTTLQVAYTSGAETPASLPAGGVVTPGSPASALFGAGITIVTYTATDRNDNTAVTSFLVTVNDDELPVITCAAPVSVNNTSDRCDATIALAVPAASDNCGILSVTNDHPSNVFPVGTTNVTWTARDVHNNIITCVQQVTVHDTEVPTISCSVDVTVQNDPGQCSAAVTLTAPVAADNCGTVQVTNDHASNMFPVGTTTVHWTVTDNAGNTAVCDQHVTVNDSEVPVILCPVSFTTVTDAAASFATITLDQPQVSDNCGIAATTNDHPSPVFPIGSTLVNWVVTDIHGNSASCVQTIVVNDTINPSISFNAPIGLSNTLGDCSGNTDITYPEASDNSGHVTVTADYSGLPVASVDPVTPLTVSNINFPVGPTTIIWTATDPSANTTWSTQMITVTDNEAPSIVCAPDVVRNNDAGVCAADIILVAPQTSDNCGVATVSNDHPSTTYNVGETIVTWTVTDIHGNSNTCTQKVTVQDVEAPSIICPAATAVFNDFGLCTATITINAPTTGDNCGIATVSSDHPSPVFNEGITLVTWTVTDIHGNTNTCVQTVTVTDNEAPVFTRPADTEIFTTASCAYNSSVAITGDVTDESDNCPASLQATFTDVVTDGPCEGSHIIKRTWSLVDAHNNSAADQVQTITVTDNTAPTFTRPANTEIFTDANCGYDASPVITGDVTNEADNCSTGIEASYSDVLVAGNCEGSHIINRTWHLVDKCGNAAADQLQVITITDNIKPVFTRPFDITVYTNANCGYDASVVATGDVTDESDNCSTGLQATFSDVVVDGSCAGAHTITRTWSLVDKCGNAADDQVQTITILDTLAPTFTRPVDITIQSDANCGYDASVDATGDVTDEADNCSANLQAVYTDVVADGECQGTHIITRTWSLADLCGNIAENQVQVITVVDKLAPVFTRPADITIYTNAQCNYDATVTAVGDVTDEMDNCSTGLQATFTDVVTPGACAGAYVITRTWHLEDHCGNKAPDQVQTIQIKDNTAPTFTVPATITVYSNASCGYDVTIAKTGDVTDEADNCSTGLQATFTDIVLDGTCEGSHVIQRVWSLVDNCGNSAADQVQLIYISDTTAPTFTKPADITIYTNASCAYDAGVGQTGDVANEADNCSTGIQAGFDDVITPGACVGSVIITRTWNLSDNCGNIAAKQVQVITVLDNIAPVITTCAPSLTVAPNNAGCTFTLPDYRTAVTATDNCSSVVLTQTPAAGTALPLGANSISIKATDACGNNTTCTFTITVNKTLDVTVGNTNPQLYYGYSLDQSTVIKGTPTGGQAPYKVVITMNRVLGCNAVNSTGDEAWVAGGGTSTGATCPTSGSGAIPVSTITNVAAGGSYSVTATLMANAVFTVTITDANGCIVSKTTNVSSEDARCFAGSSSNAKIKICHQTGIAGDKCHELCVAESAVKAHLAHGDFLGSCTPNCVAPAAPVARPVPTPEYAAVLGVKVSPNPSTTAFNVSIQGVDASPVMIRVMDIYGRIIHQYHNLGAFATLRMGDKWISGTYIIEIIQGKQSKVVKVIKAK